MDIVNIVGSVAGVFSAVSFLPQVIKIWKTKSTKDLSMLSLALLFTNVSLWLVYGILLPGWPIIVTNGFVLSMIIAMIFFKLKYK